MATIPTHKPPRITFTYDFHELVRGDLVPGAVVTLRYDPLRIVPADDDYIFGDPNRPVVAHVVFRPGDPPLSRTLQSRAGMLTNPDIDVTGNGSVLTAEQEVPSDAKDMEVWFTYASRSGLKYDNDEGRNFHFGFAGQQIRLLSATVASQQENGGAFSLRVAAQSEVERVTVRLRAVNREDFAKTELDLRKTDQVDGGWPVWELSGVPVPNQAIVQFKLYYWLSEIRYKDDNDGLYYMAPQPEPERVPPPPAELAAAAKAWT